MLQKSYKFIIAEHVSNEKKEIDDLSIFTEVKERVTAREVAEFYGLNVGKNGLACCPFHNDKHPSMKIDKFYYCFACGAKGDAINYVSDLYGLKPYEAARKIADDFHMVLESDTEVDEETRKKTLQKARNKEAEKKRMIRIQNRFGEWCNQRIEDLKRSMQIVEAAKQFFRDKPPEIILGSDDFAVLLHSEPSLNY